MVIKQLYVNGFKRTFLHNIPSFSYIPGKTFQVILGQNGSGKSSLLSLLTPFPTDIKNKFEKNGSKIIWIEHNESKYKLTTGNNDSPGYHSFIQDDIELNTGHTKTLQLELIKQHFGMNMIDQQVLSGELQLTRMPAQKRKDVLTNLSHTDYGYALSVYNKIKQRLRDVKGAIKINNESIVKSKNTLLGDDIINWYRTDVDNLKQLVELYLKEFNPNVDYNTTFEDISKTLSVITDRIQKFYNANQDKLIIRISNEDITSLQYNRDKLSDRIQSLKKKLLATERIEKARDIETHKKDLDDYKRAYKMILDSVYIPNLDVKLIKLIYTTLESNISIIIRNVDEIVDDVDVEEEANLLIKLTELTKKQVNLENKISLLSQQLDELRTKDDLNIVCPNCHSVFDPYDKEKHIKEYKKEIGEYETKIQPIKNAIDDVKEKLLIIKHKKSLLENIRNIFDSNLLLNPVLEYIVSKCDLKRNSAIFKSLLDKIYIDIKSWCAIVNIEDSIRQKQNTIEQLLSISDLEDLDQTSSEMRIELEKQYLEMQDLENKINSYQRIKNTHIEYTKLVDDLKIKFEGFKKFKKNAKEINRNKYLLESVKIIKSTIVDLETQLSEHTQRLDYIERLTTQNNELEVRYRVLEAAEKALSPTEGLIGKSINRFLNVILKDINNFINSIWSYPLELLPFSFEESGEFEYNFPVRVDNKDEPITDVSMLSSGMMDIVNLAFKVVYMKYRNLSSCPLILDEFGNTFDPIHRVAAYDIVEKMGNIFNQIFIVSHLEDSALRFGNHAADIVVLGDYSSDTIINNKNVFKIGE